MITTISDLNNLVKEIDERICDNKMLYDALMFLFCKKEFDIKEVLKSEEFQEYHLIKIKERKEEIKNNENTIIQKNNRSCIREEKTINLVKSFFEENFTNCCNFYCTKAVLLTMLNKKTNSKLSMKMLSEAIKYLIEKGYLVQYKEIIGKSSFMQINLKSNIILKN
jgi:hypothetical protein